MVLYCCKRFEVIMGIFNRKKIKEIKQEIPVSEVEKKEPFVANLSFIELQNANWKRFAGVLKKEGVLANSYDKKPVSVEYYLDKQNRPVVELIFKSTTSESVRKVQLMEDRAYLFINGVIESFPETQRNKSLNEIWKKVQEDLKYINYLNTNREGHFHKMKAERMIKQAEKMKRLENIYELEQTFLEIYKDSKFDDFCFTFIKADRNPNYPYSIYFPAFIPLLKEPINGSFRGEPAVPFSPRTLEHCILHMTKGEMVDHGEYISDFEAMCRKIQEASCYESEDWDKVIEFGKDIVRKQYIADMAANGFYMD